jgi:hypothetical protein
MEELFTIIGKLYSDLYNTQKYIEVLQNKLKIQEKQLLEAGLQTLPDQDE